MNPTTLRALWQTGHLYPEQLPDIASDLLGGGADSPALRELAGLQLPTRADAEPVMTRVLSELCVPTLEASEACQVAAREIAIRTLEGRIQPYDASASLAALCSDCGWPEDLKFFVAALDEWDDLPGAREQITGEILEECRRLVAQTPAAA